MKKLFAIAALIFALAIPAAARDKVYRSASVLPQPAKELLKKYFPKVTVNMVKVDSNLLGVKDYEVVLANGTEIEFDKEGLWEEVDCGHKAVPAGIVPGNIRSYVAKQHKGQNIVRIEKDSNDYEIELSDGTEMKFDRAGQFMRYDD